MKSPLWDFCATKKYNRKFILISAHTINVFPKWKIILLALQTSFVFREVFLAGDSFLDKERKLKENILLKLIIKQLYYIGFIQLFYYKLIPNTRVNLDHVISLPADFLVLGDPEVNTKSGRNISPSLLKFNIQLNTLAGTNNSATTSKFSTLNKIIYVTRHYYLLMKVLFCSSMYEFH